MIKNLLLVLVFIGVNLPSFSQDNSQETPIKYSNWETFGESSIRNAEEWIEENKLAFGLTPDDNLTLILEHKDVLGIDHFKFQQYYKGIKVDAAQYILHGTPDKMWGNGRLVKNLYSHTSPSVNKDQALSIALDYFDADKYYWEDASKEALLQRTTQDPEATYLPEGELVLGDRSYGQDGANYNLLWKFEIYGFNEKICEYVYVNANTGEIDHALSGVHTESVEGTASTRYYGVQNIITDSIDTDLYHLVDATRGGGVETYNLQEGDSIGDWVHFTDDDNYWDNANDEMDDAATDLHWGVEKTYDYYLTKHGRNSFDGNGSPLVTYAHYGISYNNAAWIGTYGYFGDGDDNPWTTLDIVGHEVTHGVTKNSASLIYNGESGALNESFSDIFGTAIEFYANPDSANWYNGTLNFIIRDLSDPNAFGDPDTYDGVYWLSGSGDYGGVHTNSGVQNYWYYLLVEGGEGENDNGDSYEVVGLGFDAASAITYRNLTVYLTATSNYVDARQGSIQSAMDIYGECSNEVKQVINAWQAVGLGANSFSPDLELVEIMSPINDCDLSSEEMVEVRVRLNQSGCNDVIPAGSEIDFSYLLDDNDLVNETLILTDDLEAGNVFTFSFDQSISLPEMAEEYELSVFIEYETDSLLNNNSILEYEIERKYDHGNANMGFESLSHSVDSFYVHTGNHAKVKISSLADNTGSRGLMMTAYNTSGYLSDFADDPENNFEQNPEYISKVCFCVDAQDWDNVRAKFDMMQTYSKLYVQNWGGDSAEYASSLRLLVNGQQIGDQFHPTTYADDEYLTYIYELDSLAGQYFEFCFESKNYLSGVNDYIVGSLGDNTYLDNVFFYEEGVTSIEEVLSGELSVFPNPTEDLIYIELEKEQKGVLEIIDMQGRKVFVENWTIAKSKTIDLSLLVPGVYMLFLNTEDQRYISKIQID